MFIEIIAGGNSWEVVYCQGAEELEDGEKRVTTMTRMAGLVYWERVITAPRRNEPRQKSVNRSVIAAATSLSPVEDTRVLRDLERLIVRVVIGYFMSATKEKYSGRFVL